MEYLLKCEEEPIAEKISAMEARRGHTRETRGENASLKFVFKNELVDAITIGTLKTSETDDMIERMAKV